MASDVKAASEGANRNTWLKIVRSYKEYVLSSTYHSPIRSDQNWSELVRTEWIWVDLIRSDQIPTRTDQIPTRTGQIPSRSEQIPTHFYLMDVQKL